MSFLYAAAIFLGAFLLFLVQPILARVILPWFGGVPAIWTTCMLFFQVALLGGYAYANASMQRLGARRGATVHLVLLACTLPFLPILPGAGWKPVDGDHPVTGILLLLTAVIGVPYLVLSATAPLLQAWLAEESKAGSSPYWLYAVSNGGSMLGLLVYPFVVEPWLSVSQQTTLWSWGFVAFLAAVAVLALRRRNHAGNTAGSTAPTVAHAAEPAPGLGRKLLWLGLPATAVILLLATTHEMCQEIAVIPFLWILPLAIYLLTMVLCFADDRVYFRPVFRGLLFAGLTAIGWELTKGTELGPVKGIGYLSGGLFALCMVCHGELVKLKPHPSRLTQYYLLISAGGALGGCFAGVVGPNWIPLPFELQIGMVLCVALAGLAAFVDEKAAPVRTLSKVATLGVAFAAVTVVLIVLLTQAIDHARKYRRLERNFYGVLKVRDYDAVDDDPQRRVLVNGGTKHGQQLLLGEYRREPTTYYGRRSGVGRAIQEFRRSEHQHVGVIGLGVGTIAAFGREGDRYRFYEINPRVVDLAREEFSYLGDCRAEVTIVPGDARLSLEREAPQAFDVLAVDAFSSDAIPVHLLTREALELYFRHLRADGILAIHISNRNLDLEPVVFAGADLLGKLAIEITDMEIWDRGVLSSDWILVTGNQGFVDQPVIKGDTEPRNPLPPDFRPWTDDFSNLFSVLK